MNGDKCGGGNINIGFIGAGAVGCSMGKYLCENSSIAKIKGYYSRTSKSVDIAATFTNSKAYASPEELVNECDVICITTPDDIILKVWEQIKNYNLQQKIICHFSGSLSSDIFSGIEETKAEKISIHPMYAFSSKFTSYEQLNHVIFTAEGDFYALSVVGDIFRKAGNKVCVMESAKKTRYHASASMISNLMIGLYEMSIQMLMDCGFSREDAVELTTPLVQNNIKALLHSSPEEALTGPIERGDTETVKKHLSVLTEAEKEVYLRLGETVLEIAGRKNPERDYQTMVQLLNDICRNRRTQ